VVQLLIDGKFVDAVSGKTFQTINPHDESVIMEVAEGDAADVDIAVKAARKAFDEGPWPKMTGAVRCFANHPELNWPGNACRTGAAYVSQAGSAAPSSTKVYQHPARVCFLECWRF
jgi:hypothetical protein